MSKPMSGVTQRQEKVNSVLKREIGAFIAVQGYEGIKGLLTVTKVEVSPSLEHAKAYFSVIGQDPREVLKVLREDIYEIQGAVNRRMKTKKVPRIMFVIDESGEEALRISRLIDELKKDD